MGDGPRPPSGHDRLERRHRRHAVGLRPQPDLHDPCQPERLFDHARAVLQRGHGQPPHRGREPDDRSDRLPPTIHQRHDHVDRLALASGRPLHRPGHGPDHRLGQRNDGDHHLHRDRHARRRRHRGLLVRPAEPGRSRRRRPARRLAGRLRRGRGPDARPRGRRRRRRRWPGRQRRDRLRRLRRRHGHGHEPTQSGHRWRRHLRRPPRGAGRLRERP